MNKTEMNIVLFRNYRKFVFKAFDIYKTNVIYGIEQENEVQKNLTENWYNEMLNFPESITSDTTSHNYPVLPAYIKKYM